MTTIQDIPGIRCFTAWESSAAKVCPQPGCARAWPAGTLFRWIPWLRRYNWVCPACAVKFAAEYDERIAGVATRAVAFIPAVPEIKYREALESTTAPIPPIPAVNPELVKTARKAARDRMRRTEEQAGMVRLVQGGLFG